MEAVQTVAAHQVLMDLAVQALREFRVGTVVIGQEVVRHLFLPQPVLHKQAVAVAVAGAVHQVAVV